MPPANPFPKGNVIGMETRFRRGNRASVGYGRPRTSILNRKLKKELYYNPELNLDAQVREWLAFALAGSEAHMRLIEKHAGPEHMKAITDTIEQCFQSGFSLKWRRPKRKSYSTRKTGGNREDSSAFSHTRSDFPQESASATPNSFVFNENAQSESGKRAQDNQEIDAFKPENHSFRGVSVHETARALMGIAEEKPAPVKRPIKVQLW